MNNKEMSEMVLNYLRKEGLKPYGIAYGDGYFVFDMGEDSVCHFRIKGAHGWKFALWLNQEAKDKENPIVFFCKHEDNIDKFKPSQCYYRVNFMQEDVQDDDSMALWDCKNIVVSIKKHPFASFAFDAWETSHVYRSYSSVYIKNRWYRFTQRIKAFCFDYGVYPELKLRTILFSMKKCVKNIKMKDENEDGWQSTPRWSIMISLDNSVTEEIGRIMLRKWFPYRLNVNAFSVDEDYFNE